VLLGESELSRDGACGDIVCAEEIEDIVCWDGRSEIELWRLERWCWLKLEDAEAEDIVLVARTLNKQR